MHNCCMDMPILDRPIKSLQTVTISFHILTNLCNKIGKTKSLEGYAKTPEANLQLATLQSLVATQLCSQLYKDLLSSLIAESFIIPCDHVILVSLYRFLFVDNKTK